MINRFSQSCFQCQTYRARLLDCSPSICGLIREMSTFLEASWFYLWNSGCFLARIVLTFPFFTPFVQVTGEELGLHGLGWDHIGSYRHVRRLLLATANRLILNVLVTYAWWCLVTVLYLCRKMTWLYLNGSFSKMHLLCNTASSGRVLVCGGKGLIFFFGSYSFEIAS